MNKLGFLFSALSFAGMANAQNVGIGITAPIARLHVADSNVLFTGPVTVPATTSYYPPAQGAGTRMMWYPQKAAFRVGNTNGVSWDFDNIGTCSIATGFSTYASGPYSTAMGYKTFATGFSSTAMGENTRSSGPYSTAMGYNTRASGYLSTAMGYYTEASGESSIAMGNLAQATGRSSTAMGENTSSSGNHSTSMGGYTGASGDFSTAMGLATFASGSSSTAMGNQTTARSFVEVTIGSRNTAYTPISATAWNSSDRLFGIGNGIPGSSFSDAMVVLKNGNSGFGTSAPGARLHVVSGASGYVGGNFPGITLEGSGNTYINILSPNSNETAVLFGNASDAAAGGIVYNNAGNLNGLDFRTNGNITRMFIYSNGNAWLQGTLTQASDARLKKDISPLQNPLQKIIQLNGYTYHWKNENSDNRLQTGVLAQEVQKLFPDLVSENKEGILAVNYSGLIPVMIESIKEQQKQIDELKKLVEQMIKK